MKKTKITKEEASMLPTPTKKKPGRKKKKPSYT